MLAPAWLGIPWLAQSLCRLVDCLALACAQVEWTSSVLRCLAVWLRALAVL